jgi:hypothetical protein
VFALGFASVACGEGEDEFVVRDGEQTEGFCEASCTRDVECRGSGSVGACKSYCTSYVTGLENLRADAVEIAGECILELPCATFFAADAFVPCWERAERELDPTDSTRRFCRAWSTRWFECGASYSIEECETDWVTNSSAYLDRMLTCVELS